MEILSLAVVGAVVSIVVQWTKSSLNTSPNQTRLILIGLSAVAALGWYFVRDNTVILERGAEILLIANAVYGFIIKQFEE